MIIDTSAVLTVLLGEPEAGRYEDAIAAGWELGLLLEESAIELMPVTPEHTNAAHKAWHLSGKGKHPVMKKP